MYVYIQDKTKCLLGSCKATGNGALRWKMFGDISLADGSVPVIGTNEANITGLEPAIWFKVLLIDSVCVDIDNAVVYWATCHRGSCKQRSMSRQPFGRCNHTHECLLNEEFFLPDVDLKRGLEIATRILNCQQETQQDLLHLLHVYILPIIRLHADDKDHVSMALQNQKVVLQELDGKLDTMTKQRGNIKDVMRQWRADICKMLQSDTEIALCNKDFLKVLCQHLDKDIQMAYVQLDQCQQSVDLAKQKVEKKEGNNYITQLTRARQVRDEVADYISNALFVVEEVSSMFDVTRRPPSVEMSDMQVGYIKINKEWEEHTNELRELQRRKVCATSVREALVSTRSDLDNTKETLGLHILSSGTARATDILESQSLPKEWEQLQTHVNEALSTQIHLKEPHLKFCHYLCTQVTDEIADSKTYHRQRGPSISQATKMLIEQRLRPSPEALRSLRASLKERKPTTHFQGVTKMLLKTTQDHFHKMVNLMVKDFSVPSNCSARLWTCYERCVFPEVSGDIMKIYKEAYKTEIKVLTDYLPSVSITELGLDDEWILNILGLYAPSSLTQGFMVDTQISSCHENNNEDTSPTYRDTKSDCERDGANEGCCFDNSQSNRSANCSQHRTVAATVHGNEQANIETRNVSHEHKLEKDSNSSEQSKTNTDRFEKMCEQFDDDKTCDFESSIRSESAVTLRRKPNDDERCDFESSIRSESAVRLRRKPNLNREAQRSRRLTKVVGHTWVIPPARPKSFAASDRSKHTECAKVEPASLPSMLDAEVRMSSMIGPVTLPIDIPVQRALTIPRGADSNASFKSLPAIDSASCPPSIAENKNNSRHINEESIDPCTISILVTTPTGSTGDIEDELSKRRKDPYVTEFLEKFQTAYYCFRVVLQESVPTSKFQWLCKCLREVNDVAEKQAQFIYCGKKRLLTGDDLLTTLILFVLHGEPDEMAQFYPQLKFMEDYLPEFLDKGQFGFSVYQFTFAFQYILDKQESMKRLNEECKET